MQREIIWLCPGRIQHDSSPNIGPNPAFRVIYIIITCVFPHYHHHYYLLDYHCCIHYYPVITTLLPIIMVIMTPSFLIIT